MPTTAHFKPSSFTLRYGGALIGVALATGLRLALNPALGSHLPFTTYFVAAILAAVYGGVGPALLTVALGAALGTYLFIPEGHTSAVAGSSDIPQIAAFCILSAGLSIVIKLILDARKRADKTAVALAESRNRLATILASISDAVVATDVDGRVTFMNGLAQSLTGWSEEDARGKPVQQDYSRGPVVPLR